MLAAWLLMRFAVSIPVFLLEQRGAVESMTRSGTLTQGHRGRILGATSGDVHHRFRSSVFFRDAVHTILAFHVYRGRRVCCLLGCQIGPVGVGRDWRALLRGRYS